MILHKNKDLFTELIEITADDIGLPQVYIEKDYWVTKSLKHLHDSIYVNNVIFKGGTSLSKAYQLIHRFSEDIDLAVILNNKSSARTKKLIKKIESIINRDLICIDDDSRTTKGSSFRKTVYQYPHTIDEFDFQHASSELLIEINAFTNPEEFDSCRLQSFIGECLLKKGELDLIKQSQLEPFRLNVLSVKQTLVEKIIAVIKCSYANSPAQELSKKVRHLYDIHMILQQNDYVNFIKGEEFKFSCSQCIRKEVEGNFNNSECLIHPLSEAPIFTNLNNLQPTLKIAYEQGFNSFVYGDFPSIADIFNSLELVRTCLY